MVTDAPDGSTFHEPVKFFHADCKNCESSPFFTNSLDRSVWVGKHRVSTGHSVRQYEETR